MIETGLPAKFAAKGAVHLKKLNAVINAIANDQPTRVVYRKTQRPTKFAVSCPFPPELIQEIPLGAEYLDTASITITHKVAVAMGDAVERVELVTVQRQQDTPLWCEHHDAFVVSISNDDVAVRTCGYPQRIVQLSTKFSLGPECSHELSSSAELLDSVIPTVHHQQVVVPIIRHATGTIELSIPSPLLTKREQEPSLSAEHLNSVIIPVTHGHLSVFVDRNAPRMVELSRASSLRSKGHQRLEFPGLHSDWWERSPTDVFPIHGHAHVTLSGICDQVANLVTPVLLVFDLNVPHGLLSSSSCDLHGNPVQGTVTHVSLGILGRHHKLRLKSRGSLGEFVTFSGGLDTVCVCCADATNSIISQVLVRQRILLEYNFFVALDLNFWLFGNKLLQVYFDLFSRLHDFCIATSS